MANAKPSDHTGRLKEAASKAAAEKQAADAAAAATAAEEKLKAESEVISLVSPAQVQTVVVDEQITVHSAKDETVVIRVVEDIENMTFGAGNYFSFRAGQKYEVKKTLADHLKALGYVANNL